MSKLVFISDTHCKWNKLIIPECDILFHCGDYSFKGEKHVVKNFHKWLDKQPAKHIVSVQGNHELWVEKNFEEAKEVALKACPRVHFIQHEAMEIEGLKIFGSAYTPYFFNWAWNAGRDATEAAHTFKPFIGDKWAEIPDDTEILITHGPPMGYLDIAVDYNTGQHKNVGCWELSKRIKELSSLKISAFGHLHFCGSMQMTDGNTTFINAAICNDQYEAFDNRKVIIDI